MKGSAITGPVGKEAADLWPVSLAEPLNQCTRRISDGCIAYRLQFWCGDVSCTAMSFFSPHCVFRRECATKFKDLGSKVGRAIVIHICGILDVRVSGVASEWVRPSKFIRLLLCIVRYPVGCRYRHPHTRLFAFQHNYVRTHILILHA